MQHTLILRAVAFTLLLFCAGHVCSDEKDAKKKAETPSKDAVMQAWMKAATPGAEHKRLDDLAGSFTCTVKSWMEPGQPPTDSTATSESKWLLDGRYLAQTVTGTFGGMPFHGYGLTGYDNVQKKYVAVWIDSFGTGISNSVGTASADGKTITFVREEFDPVSGEKFKSKDIVRLVDRDHHEMDMYKVLPDGKEMKVMELRYTRKK
jgi:hypothetical protein